MASEKLSHDAVYMAIFSDPAMIKSLLVDFVPESFIAEFNLNTLQIWSPASITDKLALRSNDIIWRVRWRNA